MNPTFYPACFTNRSFYELPLYESAHLQDPQLSIAPHLSSSDALAGIIHPGSQDAILLGRWLIKEEREILAFSHSLEQLEVFVSVVSPEGKKLIHKVPLENIKGGINQTLSLFELYTFLKRSPSSWEAVLKEIPGDFPNPFQVHFIPCLEGGVGFQEDEDLKSITRKLTNVETLTKDSRSLEEFRRALEIAHRCRDLPWKRFFDGCLLLARVHLQEQHALFYPFCAKLSELLKEKREGFSLRNEFLEFLSSFRQLLIEKGYPHLLESYLALAISFCEETSALEELLLLFFEGGRHVLTLANQEENFEKYKRATFYYTAAYHLTQSHVLLQPKQWEAFQALLSVQGDYLNKKTVGFKDLFSFYETDKCAFAKVEKLSPAAREELLNELEQMAEALLVRGCSKIAYQLYGLASTLNEHFKIYKKRFSLTASDTLSSIPLEILERATHFRKELHALRDHNARLLHTEYSQEKKVSSAHQKENNEKYSVLISTLFSQCVSLLDPKKEHVFALLSVGSLSRQEMCPFSDFEAMLLRGEITLEQVLHEQAKSDGKVEEIVKWVKYQQEQFQGTKSFTEIVAERLNAEGRFKELVGEIQSQSPAPTFMQGIAQGRSPSFSQGLEEKLEVAIGKGSEKNLQTILEKLKNKKTLQRKSFSEVLQKQLEDQRVFEQVIENGRKRQVEENAGKGTLFKKSSDFFTSLGELFSLQVIAMGETQWSIIKGEKSVLPKGFCLDASNNPRSLCDFAAHFAARQMQEKKGEDVVQLNVLRSVRFLLGTKELYDNYQSLLQDSLNAQGDLWRKNHAINTIKYCLKQYSVDAIDFEKFHVKEDLLRLPLFTLEALCLFYKIDTACHTVDKIDLLCEKGLFPKSLQEPFKALIEFSFFLRWKAHLRARAEDDTLNLSLEEREKVEEACSLLLKPLKETLKAWLSNERAFQEALFFARGYFNKAKSLLEKKAYEKAISYLETAVALDKHNYSYQFALGKLYFVLGSFSEAHREWLSLKNTAPLLLGEDLQYLIGLAEEEQKAEEILGMSLKSLGKEEYKIEISRRIQYFITLEEDRENLLQDHVQYSGKIRENVREFLEKDIELLKEENKKIERFLQKPQKEVEGLIREEIVRSGLNGSLEVILVFKEELETLLIEFAQNPTEDSRKKIVDFLHEKEKRNQVEASLTLSSPPQTSKEVRDKRRETISMKKPIKAIDRRTAVMMIDTVGNSGETPLERALQFKEKLKDFLEEIIEASFTLDLSQGSQVTSISNEIKKEIKKGLFKIEEQDEIDLDSLDEVQEKRASLPFELETLIEKVTANLFEKGAFETDFLHDPQQFKQEIAALLGESLPQEAQFTRLLDVFLKEKGEDFLKESIQEILHEARENQSLLRYNLKVHLQGKVERVLGQFLPSILTEMLKSIVHDPSLFIFSFKESVISSMHKPLQSVLQKQESSNWQNDIEALLLEKIGFILRSNLTKVLKSTSAQQLKDLQKELDRLNKLERLKENVIPNIIAYAFELSADRRKKLDGSVNAALTLHMSIKELKKAPSAYLHLLLAFWLEVAVQDLSFYSHFQEVYPCLPSVHRKALRRKLISSFPHKVYPLERFYSSEGYIFSALVQKEKWMAKLKALTEPAFKSPVPGVVAPTPSVLVKGMGLGRCFLSDWHEKVLFKNMEFERTHSWGRQSVVKLTDMFFKKNETGQMVSEFIDIYFKKSPESPGDEYAVFLLNHLLTGQGSPPTEIMEIQSRGTQHFVLASQTVQGEPFHYFLSSSQEELHKVDKKQFSQMMLMALLIEPEDGKAENYIAQAQYNVGNLVDNLKIIGIDNERSFVQSFWEKRGLFNQAQLLIKTVLFCLDQMKEPIHPEVRENYLKLSPLTVLEEWLEILQLYNDRVEEFLTPEALNRYWKEGILIPFFIHPHHVIHLYDKMMRIRQAFLEGVNSHLELLKKIDLRAGNLYESALDRVPLPSQRFTLLTADAYKKNTNHQLFNRTTIKEIKKAVLGDGLEKIEDFKKKALSPQEGLNRLKFALEDGIREKVTDPIIEKQIEKEIALMKTWVGIHQQEESLKQKKWNNARIEELEALRGLPFRELSLRHFLTLRDKDLESLLVSCVNPLTEKVELRKLDLKRCIGLTKIEVIQKACPQLETLSLAQIPFYKIEIVDSLLEKTHWKCLSFLSLKKCESLTEVKIESSTLKTLDLKGCVNLTSLKLHCPQLIDLNVKGCSSLDGKKYESGEKNPIDANLFSCIRSIQDKQGDTLSFSGPALQQTAQILHKALQNNTKIKTLTLTYSFSSSPEYSPNALNGIHLQELAALEKLTIQSDNVKSVHIKNCPELKEVALECPCLEELEIKGCAKMQMEKTLRFVRDNLQMQCLTLSHTEIALEDIEKMGTMFKRFSHLRLLDLSYSSMDLFGVTALVQELKENKNKKGLMLNLSYNKITSDGLEVIGDILNKTISLDLSHNPISSTGIAKLLPCIASASMLKHLLLCGLELGDEGAFFVAQALETNTLLNSLDLRRCRISDAGAQALAGPLEKNRSLSSLNLSSNRIGEVGALALAKAIERSSGLRRIDLRDNPIKDQGKEKLFKSIESRESCKGIESLAKVLQERQGDIPRDFSFEEFSGFTGHFLSQRLGKNKPMQDIGEKTLELLNIELPFELLL